MCNKAIQTFDKRTLLLHPSNVQWIASSLRICSSVFELEVIFSATMLSWINEKGKGKSEGRKEEICLVKETEETELEVGSEEEGKRKK